LVLCLLGRCRSDCLPATLPELSLADRQQETEGDEGATVLWAFEVPQFVVEAKLEPEHAYTAEEYKMISEEKKRQMGGRKSAVWTGEEARLLEDAKRRREAEKSEKDEG
jgi:hypothetical protein